jgi:hypothetical protein
MANERGMCLQADAMALQGFTVRQRSCCITEKVCWCLHLTALPSPV